MTRSLGIALAVFLFAVVSPAKADGTVNVKCGLNEDRVWVYESLDDFNLAAKLKCGEAVQIVGRVKGYVKIQTANGTEGYVVDTVFLKSVLPPEPEEKPNGVQSASLAAAARRASKASAKSATASTLVATSATPTTRLVAPKVAPAPAANSISITSATLAAPAGPATNVPANTPPPATMASAATGPSVSAAPVTNSPGPLVVATNIALSATAPPTPHSAQSGMVVVQPGSAATSEPAKVVNVESAPPPPASAPAAPKVSASNSIAHPTASRMITGESNVPVLPEIAVSRPKPNLASATTPPPPRIELSSASAAVVSRRAAASAPTAPSVKTATEPILVAAAVSPAIAPPPAPPAATAASLPVASHANSNNVGQSRSTAANLQPISNPIPRPDAVKKSTVNPDEEEDSSVKTLEAETANCSIYFSAYGLSPNQYKWIAQNRTKAFPSVCPAPSPAMVDFVVIFTHDVAFYNVTMPDAVHFEANGFSDWTPLTTVDTALMNASDADKSHHEYVWVFHTTRGAFEPAKFSTRRHPLFSKSETNTLGSRGGFRTVMDALTFIEQNGTNQ